MWFQELTTINMLMALILQMHDDDTANDWESHYFLRDMLSKLKFTILAHLCPIMMSTLGKTLPNLSDSCPIKSKFFPC